MKKFKKIMSQLHEAGEQSSSSTVFNGFSDQPTRSVFSDRGAHYAFKETEQLNRVNAFITSYLTGMYMDPKEPLKELSVRLATLGYVLEFNNDTILHMGTNSLKVKIYGDKFGTTPTTDLTKDGFDTGNDYPDMALVFELVSSPRGYCLHDPRLESPLSSGSPTKIDAEMNNSHNVGQGIPAALVAIPQNESVLMVEHETIKDPTRVVELFLSGNKDIHKKLLSPIYQSLIALKENGNYDKESALKRFVYVVKSAMHHSSLKQRNITLTPEQITQAAKRLLYNFEKSSR